MKEMLENHRRSSPVAEVLGWKQWLRDWGQRIRQREDQFFLILTLLIGALTGLVVVAFIVVTERLGAKLHGDSAAWRFWTPIAGSLLAGYLLHHFFPEARGSGIPQTKVALFVRNGRIRARAVVGRFICSSLSLASGIALGREGPSVQLGSGIASIIGRKLGLGPQKVKALIPVGAAAALAAAFNTPIAAVLFALEEIMGDLHAPVLGSVVLSSATSWVVLHLLLGDEALFHVPAYQLVHPGEFGVYAVLGIAGGVISVVFVESTLSMRRFFLSLPLKTRWIQPLAGGLMVGALGFFVPDVLGVGYSFVGKVLNGNAAMQFMLLLLGLKLVATVTCYASGNAGGIFGPALFLGACLGGTVGTVAHWMFPAYTASPGAYALVGMGAAFAGIIRSPLTSVFMIFEITRDYNIVVPLMIANLISFYLARRFQPEPIYEALAQQDGIHLPQPEQYRRHTQRTVGQAMLTQPYTVPPSATIGELPTDAPYGLFVVAEGNLLWGMATVEQVTHYRRIGEHLRPIQTLLHTPPRTKDHLDFENFPHVHSDQPLELAMERMGRLGIDLLPVVDRANVRRLKGVIGVREAMHAYGLETTAESYSEPG